MEPRTIKFLPLDQMRILKQIFIVNENKYDREVAVGYILYERKLTKEYKFSETPKEERDFRYYLEYPRQDSYPNDEVDDLILQSIKNTYPKSYLKNHSIICNVDTEKYDVLKKPENQPSVINVSPDFQE